MDAFAASLQNSPELFPHALNVGADSVSFLRLAEKDYEAAAFLDERILTRQTISRAIPWLQVARALQEIQLREGCDLIFHTGHVGSTLISRLLGRHASVFGIREPGILRTLTQIRCEPEDAPQRWSDPAFEARLSGLLKLWSRTFRPEQRACVKTTSFVSELARELLLRPFQPRAIFVFVPAKTYLATILGGPNSRKESRVLAQSRLQRLERRLGQQPWNLSELSEGESIAMSWACEMTALSAGASAAGERVLWVNFDRFLAEPHASLKLAFDHFGRNVDEKTIGQILSGPDMHRYSKAPEHAYDVNLRHAVLNQARAEFANEIARGLGWLERAMVDFPVIATAMQMPRQAQLA